VRDGELAVHQVALVLGVEDRLLDVLAREGAHRLERLPEGDRQELLTVAV